MRLETNVPMFRLTSANTIKKWFLIKQCCVGTGTVINKSGIKQYQQATRDRSKVSHLRPPTEQSPLFNRSVPITMEPL